MQGGRAPVSSRGGGGSRPGAAPCHLCHPAWPKGTRSERSGHSSGDAARSTAVSAKCTEGRGRPNPALCSKEDAATRTESPPPRLSVAKSLQPGPEAPSLVPEARSPGRAPRVVLPAATLVTLPRSRCLCRLPGASGDRRHLRPLQGPDPPPPRGGEGASRAELPPGPLTPAPLGASSRGPPAPLRASGLLGPSPGSDTVPAAHEVLLPVIPSQGPFSYLVKTGGRTLWAPQQRPHCPEKLLLDTNGFVRQPS